MGLLISETSWGHGVALAVAPKIPASLSLLGSLYIVYDILKMPRPKRRVYHRLLLGMSLFDCLASIAWFLGTWTLPAESIPIYGANGSNATCATQGFFVQLSISTVLYNGCLAVYYFLVIRLGWTDDRIKKSKVEYAFHALPTLFGLGTATAALSMGLFNPLGWECWISGVPINCEESWRHDGKTTCIRGDNAKSWQWIFHLGPLWCTIVLVATLMSLIVGYVVRQEKSNARWDFQSNSDSSSPHLQTPSSTALKSSMVTASLQTFRVRSSQRVRETTWQAVCYVGSFLLTWTFPTILIINEVSGSGIWYHWLFLAALTNPSQGFFNFLTYVRPRIQRARAQRRQQRKRRLDMAQRQLVLATRSDARSNADGSCKSHPSSGGASFSLAPVGQPVLLEDHDEEITESTTMEPL